MVKFGEIAREVRTVWKEMREGVPVVGLEHIVPGEMELKKYDLPEENTFTKKFCKGQVLFGRRRAYQKKATVATFDGICSGDITVIEPIPGMVVPELLPFIVANDRFFDHAIQGSAGSLSPRVKWEHMANYEFELPTLGEQKVLANKLWAAYRLKEAYQRLLNATDEMVKSQFLEMFGGISNSAALTDICSPKQWKTIPTKDFTVDGFLVYGANGVIGRYPEYNHEKPTILIACRGASCGTINVSQPKSYITGNAMCLDNVNEDYTLDFLSFYLRIYDFTSIITGGAQPQITRENLAKVKVIKPQIEAQKRFSIIYRQADKSKFELRKAISAIDEVIKSLING